MPLDLQPLLEFFVLLASGIFAGAAIYVSAVEHPARMTLPVTETVAEFRPSYKRGAVMQAGLALIAGGGGLAAGIAAHSTTWIVGGALLLMLIPYTLLAIRPTNHRLMDKTITLSDMEAGRLLRRWGRLHGVRTLFGVSAFLVMTYGVFSAWSF